MAEKARILVVDDEVGPRESLRMILKPNYDVHTAESGETALRETSTFRPDLVFMDIKMTPMDGLEALRRIKAQDPSIEVVMITAYASLETAKSALTHGAFEYLIKPFSRQDLEETVRRALDRRRAERGTRGEVARLAGVRLGSVVTFSESFSGQAPRFYEKAYGLGIGGGGGAPDTQAGSQEITVNVSVVFEIR